MPFHLKSFIAFAITAGAFGVPAQAQEKGAPPAPPAVVKALVDCRGISDTAQRLTCYDAGTDALVQAQRTGDLVVRDREQIRKERRGLFGLSLADLNPFGGGDDEDEIETFEGTIKSVSGDRTAYVVELNEGGVWRQSDQRYPGFSPQVGQKITIRKAALGSYMARVENKGGFRVKRLR